MTLRGVKTGIKAEIRMVDPEAGRAEILIEAYDMDGNDVTNLSREELAAICRMANAQN